MQLDDLDDMHAYYARGEEAARLDDPCGVVEFQRTTSILRRVLPPAPAVVADIGGGPGRYTVWLAESGYRVVHRDLVAAHVERVRSLTSPTVVDSDVGDARALDLADESVDAVLLLGPLYHLTRRAERVLALGEARRVIRGGGVVVAAAISRWAPRLDGIVTQRLYEEYPQLLDALTEVETTGELPAVHEAAFCGYTHTPAELCDEVADAGLERLEIAGVEGLSFALGDLRERVADPHALAILIESAERIESVPELLGLSPHLLATARRPAA